MTLLRDNKGGRGFHKLDGKINFYVLILKKVDLLQQKEEGSQGGCSPVPGALKT